MTTAQPNLQVIFNQIALRIIKEQENVIGSLAWKEAEGISGLRIIKGKDPEVSIIGEPKGVINELVKRYEDLFGRISHDVCRQAVLDLTAEIREDDIPTSLK